MRFGPLLIILICSALLVSCRATRSASSPSAPSGAAGEYIDTYRDIAISEMKRTGVPASITLAQGLVESGNGRSRLAVEANNHFGIKCHNGWNGPSIRHTDDRRNECFRKYRSAEESFRDHSDFLSNTPRYDFLFDLDQTDYKAWARGLKRAGYATNPDYANMLIRKIEELGLYEYDTYRIGEARPENNSGRNETITTDPARDTLTISDRGNNNGSALYYRTPPPRVSENNRIQYLIADEDDTRASIEKEFGLLSWELQRYNELDAGFVVTPGQMLYLQPKRDKAEPGKETHVVKKGETMYAISQIYGIRIKSLYLLNRMQEDTEPAEGQTIWLRKVRPFD